jgi:hypothetical protein
MVPVNKIHFIQQLALTLAGWKQRILPTKRFLSGVRQIFPAAPQNMRQSLDFIEYP